MSLDVRFPLKSSSTCQKESMYSMIKDPQVCIVGTSFSGYNSQVAFADSHNMISQLQPLVQDSLTIQAQSQAEKREKTEMFHLSSLGCLGTQC